MSPNYPLTKESAHELLLWPCHLLASLEISELAYRVLPRFVPALVLYAVWAQGGSCVWDLDLEISNIKAAWSLWTSTWLKATTVGTKLGEFLYPVSVVKVVCAWL